MSIYYNFKLFSRKFRTLMWSNSIWVFLFSEICIYHIVYFLLIEPLFLFQIYPGFLQLFSFFFRLTWREWEIITFLVPKPAQTEANEEYFFQPEQSDKSCLPSIIQSPDLMRPADSSFTLRLDLNIESGVQGGAAHCWSVEGGTVTEVFVSSVSRFWTHGWLWPPLPHRWKQLTSDENSRSGSSAPPVLQLQALKMF